MKGPMDDIISEPQANLALAPKTVEEKPPKVLQRLALFNGSRGLPRVEPTERGMAVSGKAKEPTAPEEYTEGQQPEARMELDARMELEATKEIGQLYIEAANALHVGAEPDFGTLGPPTGIGPQWRFLGPTMTANGQTYGDSRVVVSGRVAAIAVDPSNSNHLLCGSAGGGVWESRDRGTTWAPRTDYMPTLTVGALAFNPTAPNTVYCGTGEGNFYARLGAGVLRSTDGGTTWAVLASSPFVGQGFYDLVVDRANGNHLLAATTSGIYISNDGGATWTLRHSGRCWDLSMHPAGGAAAEILAACVDGIYRSNDGGTTWTKVTLPGAPGGFDRLAVDISRSNPAVAYAFGASGATAFLYRRNSSGAWQSTTPPSGLNTRQAWYDWFLAVSPDTDTQIYLGAMEVYRGTLSGTSWSWITISNKAGDDIHPDQHAIAIDPANANVIYVGNDGGLFSSPNRGINWTSLNNGLGITELEYIAQDYGSSRWLMGGTQDNGSIRYTGSSAWDHIADGDGGDCGVNRTNPTTVFHTYFNMGMERSTTKGDFGSFGWIGPSPAAGYSNLFYPPMEVNNTTVAQAGQSVFVSRDSGSSWKEVALPAGQVASAMYIPNTNTVFVGTIDGRVYRITWSGSAWSAAAALNSPRLNAWISDIFVDPNNLNRLWITYTTIGGGRIYRSDNGGTSWVDRSAGLPSLPINAVEVDPGNANRIWVAADVGVYQSRDGGTSWASFANGLPNALAADLLFHPHARVLRVGLRNRGVWEIPVDGWLVNPICGVQWTGSLAANQSRRWFTFNWPATWHVIWTAMPTSPQPGAPQITWNVQVERASAEFVTYWITVTNLTSNPVTFEGRYAILSRY
jgi:ligand-binding sensor domain-containing protein